LEKAVRNLQLSSEKRHFGVFFLSPGRGKGMYKELITVNVADIVPYDNNPRRNDQAVEAVKESIKQCEYVAPIIVDEDMVVLAGHTRLKALKELGRQIADVMQVSGLTEEQKKKYRLLDNKTNELASWDWDKLELELDGLDFGGFDFGFELAEDDSPNEISEAKYKESISVVIDCENEEEAEQIFETLTDEGYKCHISTL
jgi:hypothetical protein